MHNDEIRTAIWRAEIPPHKKITLLCFAECAEGANGRNCSPGIETIAELVRKSPLAVKNDVKWLVEQHLLVPNGLNIHKSRYNIGLKALGLTEQNARPSPAIPKPITDEHAENMRWLEDYDRDVQQGVHIVASRRAYAEKLRREIFATP